MPTKRHEHVEVVTDHAALVSVACELITAAAAISIGRQRLFPLPWPAAAPPAPVCRALAEDRDIDWRRWQLFFGDERTVPPDHPDSNYRMVRATLIDNLPIQPLVLRVPRKPTLRPRPIPARARCARWCRATAAPSASGNPR
ncbi:MAG: 6-phosphogluconolactonase [Caldilineaceae bacterium]